MSLQSFEPAVAYDAPLGELGYVLLPDPEEPQHRFYRRPDERPRRVNIHLCERDGPWERRHLLFRDYLRATPEARNEYAQLKRSLASSHGDDRYRYTDAKGPFIQRIGHDAERWAAQTAWSPGPSDA